MKRFRHIIKLKVLRLVKSSAFIFILGVLPHVLHYGA